MHITIESPGGPRQGVVPSAGIVDEATFIKALILTLAVEGNKGVDYLTLEVDLSDAEPERLVEVAKAIGSKGH